MTTGRIFADNGLLGSFFRCLPPLPLSSPLSSPLRPPLKRSPQNDEIIGGQTRARVFASACVGADRKFSSCKQRTLERTRPLKLIPLVRHNPNDGKSVGIAVSFPEMKKCPSLSLSVSVSLGVERLSSSFAIHFHSLIALH